MIDPKELMQGNFVLYNGNEVIITEIRKKNCRIELAPPKTFVKDIGYSAIHPIPLTPAILERCGFVTTDGLNWNFYIGGDEYRNIRDRKHLSWHLNLRELELDMDRLCFMRLKDTSLHQLQNLANVLGVKLEVK